MSTDDAARRWAETWERGWREHDVDAIAALYADGAVFRTGPFRELDDPRRYVEWAFSDEDAAEVRFATPVVAGDRAFVEWWAVSRSQSGDEDTIAGASILRFDADGLVVDQRDHWALQPGRREPHEHFGS